MKKAIEAKENRKSFLECIEKIKPGVSDKVFLDQSDHVVFLGGRVYSYNDEISVSAPLSLSGATIEGAVVAKELHGILKRMKGETVEILLKEDELILSSGKFRSGLKFNRDLRLPLEMYQEEEDWEWTSLPSDFLQAVSFVQFSVSRDPSYPILNCIYVHEDCADATDNYRIIRYRTKKKISTPFLLPGHVVRDMKNGDFREVCVHDSWVHLRAEDGLIFSARTFEAEYPDITPFLRGPGEEAKGRLILPRKIADMIERSSVFFSSTDSKFDREVEVEVEKGKFILKGKSEAGWSEEEANVRYEGVPVSFRINPDFLSEISNEIRECVVGERTILFEGDNWTHVIALRKAG